MAQTTIQQNSIAPLRNVQLFHVMMQQLDDRSDGAPGMGVFYGPAGFGKSQASIWSATRRRACLVQCESTWTPTALCHAILEELGVKATPPVWRMSKQIQTALASENIPLIIDEADYVVTRKYIELIRDIYEKSLVPVVLIGEENLPQKLRKWDRFNSRILVREGAQPMGGEDFATLAGVRCPDLEMSTDLEAKIIEVSKGSARWVVVNLDFVHRTAKKLGKSTLSLSDIDERKLQSGEAGPPRRFAG
ncbi:AAA family ATPase [Epibacterium ulvae]|uniref:AAA family ATPase n=1 Tax=Epibacterium ulvae TaxID=1156985 RepID=UPI0024927E5C|nr:ATP-binding protein [Epibacterium ulvae]